MVGFRYPNQLVVVLPLIHNFMLFVNFVVNEQ